jgi:Ni,Fe-hydrogenase I large subunit
MPACARRYQAELAAAVARAQEAEVELHMLQQRVSHLVAQNKQKNVSKQEQTEELFEKQKTTGHLQRPRYSLAHASSACTP